ncbi:hypothetical protein BRC65_00925 [Halobacteriales archaeon QH_2_65_14]|nr:MAG: hypothetical protein BRC65_00925 [Halobacteriales archaeon QH_2_65_14]
MGIGNKFCQLGRALEEWTDEQVTIRSVTVDSENGLDGGEELSVDVSLSFPVAGSDENGGQVFDCTPDVTADGSLAITVETDVPFEGDVEPKDVTFNPDGTVSTTVAFTVPQTESTAERRDDRRNGDSPGSPHSEKPATDNREVPPFKNPELLKQVYESHDTFAEMADVIEMDVTGETVRRYMIDYSIHQPNSYETARKNGASIQDVAADREAEQSVVLPDGIGLPDSVSVDELIETVSRSNTLYEVKEDLDMERKEVHEMLKELNLVDVVMGRLSNDKNTEMTREDIIDRLRKASAER